MPAQHSTETDARSSKPRRVNLRASARQEQVIRRAAAATDRTMTDFILDSAMARAEQVLADRRWFIASQAQWAEFERLLDEPLPSTKRFEALAARPSPFSAPEP
ncbi:MAG: DUF1778 domain-containing protein [Actinomycetes bacterium]